MEDAQFGRRPKLFSQGFVMAILAMFCLSCNGYILNPTMPIYLVEIGLDKSISGIMTTVGSIGSLCFKPFAGRFVDTLGKKKMFYLGIGLATVINACYLVATTLPQLLIIRVISGMAGALGSTALTAMVIDIIPPSRRAEGIGYYTIDGALAQSFAPTLGLALQTIGGVSPVFLCVAAMTLGAFLMGIFIPYQDHPIPRSEMPKIRLFEKSALMPAIMNFMVYMSQATLGIYLALYGVSEGITGLKDFFMFTCVGIVFSRLFMSQILAKLGEGRVLTVSTVASAICFVLVSVAREYWFFMGIAFVYGFTYGILYPMYNIMSFRYASPENRGAATATFTLSSDLSSLFGSLVWGIVLARVSFQAMYRWAAVILLIIPILYFKVYLPKYPLKKD